MSAVNAVPFLNVPSMYNRRRALHSRHKEDHSDDAFLSSDLELSFASNVSLSSPTRDFVDLTPDSDYGIPMDISPMPPKKPTPAKVTTRPRASTVSARLFGNDVSNKDSLRTSDTQRGRAGSIHTTSKRIVQRPALPSEWRATQPPSPVDDAMDVDTSFIIDPQPPPTSISSPVITQSTVPTIYSFSNLFHDTTSPGPDYETTKRRSHSPDGKQPYSDGPLSSSPGLPYSPSDRSLNRLHAPKPFLLGLVESSLHKRPRRPTQSNTQNDSDVTSIHSAFPTLDGAQALNGYEGYDDPPARRAFSATLAPPGGSFSPDSSFEEPEASSPAQAYAQRQRAKFIRRRDGSDNLRPATALAMQESPSRRSLGGGIPGFGDNERTGKILPCRSVREDGLMRVTPQTLNDLLDGTFNDRIHDFHIIDCRFDYEYEGGHIPGAVNINTPAAVESLLLGPSLTKPKPSVSGDPYRKTILIFHCEFSQKRAPTFAKQLRARDRSMNHGIYPKIHYPEVYVLEGGYCGYFRAFPGRCEPRAYVTMDDPSHAVSRREDLDQFRKAKFGRHKSYAYGDSNGRLAPAFPQASKRSTMPTNNGVPHVYAAGSAARSRRGGGGGGALKTLNEDTGVADEGDTDTDLGDSPCPRQPQTKKTRAPLSRAETYGPSRMPF